MRLFHGLRIRAAADPAVSPESGLSGGPGGSGRRLVFQRLWCVLTLLRLLPCSLSLSLPPSLSLSLSVSRSTPPGWNRASERVCVCVCVYVCERVCVALSLVRSAQLLFLPPFTLLHSRLFPFSFLTYPLCVRVCECVCVCVSVCVCFSPWGKTEAAPLASLL